MKRNQRTPTRRPPATKLSTLTNAALSDVATVSRRLSALSLDALDGHSQSLLQQLQDSVNSLQSDSQTGNASLSLLSVQLEKLSVQLTSFSVESKALQSALVANTTACEKLAIELESSQQFWTAKAQRDQELQESNRQENARNRLLEEQLNNFVQEFRRCSQRSAAMESQYRRFASELERLNESGG